MKELMGIFFVLFVCCLVSFIVSHLWVGLWDMVITGIKRFFGIQKKQTGNWHVLKEKTDQEEKE